MLFKKDFGHNFFLPSKRHEQNFNLKAVYLADGAAPFLVQLCRTDLQYILAFMEVNILCPGDKVSLTCY